MNGGIIKKVETGRKNKNAQYIFISYRALGDQDAHIGEEMEKIKIKAITEKYEQEVSVELEPPSSLEIIEQMIDGARKFKQSVILTDKNHRGQIDWIDVTRVYLEKIKKDLIEYGVVDV